MIEETTNLKRVKPEPGDGSTPSHKRLKPDQLERVVTPEDLRPTEDLKPKKMKVADLRVALQERGLSTDGLKAVLADHLQVVLDEAEFGLDEPAAPGAPSSETQPDESQVEITRHVDHETRAKEALRAAERAGDIIDVDALDDAAAAPVVHQPATAPESIVVKAEKLQQAKDATAARAKAEATYQARVWAHDRAEAAPLGTGRTAKINCACVLADADAQHLEVGRAASGAGLAALRRAAPALDSILRAGGGQLIAATATPRAVAATEKGETIVSCSAEATVNAAMVEHRGGHYADGHANIEDAVGSVLRATNTTVALALKTGGLDLPPRAQAAAWASLRTCDGLTDALETEGGPKAGDGLLEGVELGDYQRETIAWLVAREQSPRSMEDLFASSFSKDLAVVTLPAPSFRHDWPKGGGSEAERAAQRAKADVRCYFRSPVARKHRGGFLAEDMGLGKTLEVICLALAHPAPPAWVAASRRRVKATLVVAPPSLLRQWARECRHRAPALKVLEYGLSATDGVLRQRGARDADVILCGYAAAGSLGDDVEFWRVCLDEPHAHLTASPRTNRIDFSPAVAVCAAIDAPNRWGVTGTPVTNSLFDLLGPLVFLRLAPELVSLNYFRCILANNWLSPFNSTAEVMCSLLKPLVVRHSKTSERNGAALVALPPLEARDDRAVHARSDVFDRAVAWKVTESRIHAAAQALKPLDWLCAGVDPEARHKHDSIAGASNLDELPVNVPRRPDAEATADTVATQDLHAFRRDLDENLRTRGAERRCVCCLRPNVGSLAPRAPATCGHLFCGDCVESLFEKAKSTSETVEGVAYAVPDDQLRGDDIVRDRPYLSVTGGFPAGLHNYVDQRKATEALEKVFAPYCDGKRPEVRLSVEYNKDPRAKVILPSREAEDRAAQALDGKDAAQVFPGADFSHYDPRDGVPPITVARLHRTVASVVCPACKCRFAAEDVLDLEADVLDVPQQGGRWSSAVRNFALTRARSRTARRAAAKAAVIDEAYLAPARAKAEECARLVTQDDRKAIVFCDQAESVPIVVAALEATGVAAASFTGAASRVKRDQAIAGEWDALVTTVAAGGVGLNLTQASRAVFFEPLLDIAAFRQAIGRVHRIGQKRPVAVHVLAVAGTHEHIALDLVTKRMNVTDDEADQRVLKQLKLCKTFKLL